MDKEYTIKTKEDIKIIVIRRKTLKVSLISLTVLLVVIPFGLYKTQKVSASNKINCGAFPSQYVAQQAFDFDKTFYARLDRDKDGKACENYKYKQ